MLVNDRLVSFQGVPCKRICLYVEYAAAADHAQGENYSPREDYLRENFF